METIQEVYQNNILPLTEEERLRLVALIVSDISTGKKNEGNPVEAGGIREIFGTWSGADPNGADNDKIDADLVRAYADNHEDED